MSAVPAKSFSLKKKFLKDQLDTAISVSAPAELLQKGAPFPPGQITLGKMSAAVNGSSPLTLGDVELSGAADASFLLGIYPDAQAAIKALFPSTELSAGLNLNTEIPARFAVVQAAYDIRGTAKGAVALGTGINATFGVSGSNTGLFGVVHRFTDTEPALKVLQDTFSTWALPRMVDSAADLLPGSWIISEVEGSIAVTMGVQAGYDFSWLREIEGGALQGDIGLRVQLGASAAFGFEASGKYAVVLGRETDAETFRLRLFKLSKKGWNFALGAHVGAKAQLPPFLKQSHKPEELVAAVFGLNDNQLIQDLHDAREFVNSSVSLQEKLSGLLVDLGTKQLKNANVDVKKLYEAGRAQVQTMLHQLDELEKTAGHELTSLLLSYSGVQIDELKPMLEKIAGAGGPAEVKKLLRGLLSKAGFERSPIGRLVEAAAGSSLNAITENPIAEKVQATAQQVLDVINGKTLQNVLDYIAKKVNLQKVMDITNETDYAKVDNWLKSRLATFLEKDEVVMADLQKIQDAIKTVFAKADQFTAAALAAAQKNLEMSWASTHSRSTARTALIDIQFDLTKPGNLERVRAAINGEFSNLLLEEIDGISLGEAELTHGLKRNTSNELTMPFGSKGSAVETVSNASLQIVEDGGRVLVYSLSAGDTVRERRSFFRARAGRDCSLTITGTMPLGMSSGVRVWNDSVFTYSHEMKRAVVRMRVSQMEKEVGPLVGTYLRSSFEGGRAFSEWIADLDKLLDGQDPNSGTHDVGDTLVSLAVTAPSAYLKAWSKAPADKKHATYMQLSINLQAELKKLVMFYYFSDASRFADLDAAAAPIVYASLPPSTSIQLNGAQEIERFNTNKDLYWNQIEPKEVQAMVRSKQTMNSLRARMNSIAEMLRGIPELASVSNRYDFDQTNYNNIVAAALSRRVFLTSLLNVEAMLIESAAKSGLEFANFRERGAREPAKALAKLAEFGETLTSTFNSNFAGDVFLSEAARPLGTLLFLQAARAFDPKLANIPIPAMLNIKVIKSGMLSVDDMLAGKITDEMVLFEQPFVEA